MLDEKGAMAIESLGTTDVAYKRLVQTVASLDNGSSHTGEITVHTRMRRRLQRFRNLRATNSNLLPKLHICIYEMSCSLHIKKVLCVMMHYLAVNNV